jgi:hypothetical protein
MVVVGILLPHALNPTKNKYFLTVFWREFWNEESSRLAKSANCCSQQSAVIYWTKLVGDF